jgi:hypothetical protein
MNKRQRIIHIIRKEYERAESAYRIAFANRVGVDAACNAWDDFNKDDGVGSISANPHCPQMAQKTEDAARVYAAQMREAYEHVVDVFTEDDV